MSIFNIITDILGLLIGIIPLLKKTSPQNNINNSTITNTSINLSYINKNYNEHQYITNRNNVFKHTLIYKIILVLFLIIIIIWFYYGYKNINISIENSYIIFPKLSKALQVLFFAMFNTIKSIIPAIFILACNLGYKNYKNTCNSYRIFHIICYGLLAISVIFNLIVLNKIDYTFFYNNYYSQHTNLFKNFLSSISQASLFSQVFFYFFCIFELVKNYTFNPIKSELLEVNFKHITTTISLPIIFILFSLYIIILI